MRVGKQLQAAKGPNNNRHSDSLPKKESTYSFQGIFKKGDVVDDADEKMR
jgi:hypothetical protein